MVLNGVLSNGKTTDSVEFIITFKNLIDSDSEEVSSDIEDTEVDQLEEDIPEESDFDVETYAPQHAYNETSEEIGPPTYWIELKSSGMLELRFSEMMKMPEGLQAGQRILEAST